MTHCDVSNAFLNSDELQRDVFCQFPSGMSVSECKFGKIKRPVYGMHEASLSWYEASHNFLVGFGFSRSSIEPCLYIFYVDAVFAAIVVAVDDYAIAHNSKIWFTNFYNSFNKKFPVKDLGSLDLFLGVHLEWSEDRSELHLSQERQSSDTLERFNMSDCKAAGTPAELNLDTSPVPKENVSPSFPFLACIGALLWLARNTKHEILQAVIELSRYSSNFTSYHVDCLRRIMRYVKGTISHGKYFRCSGTSLTTSGKMRVPFRLYADSDWARCKATRRSTGGYVLTLFGNALSVASKRFPTVALSTMEAEYMTLSESLRSLMHFRNLAKEFDCFEVPDKLDVFCDNQSAIFISENLVNNNRSKHIDIRFHFIREKIQEGLVNLSHIATELNMADIFTKPLTTEVFTRLRSMFMGY